MTCPVVARLTLRRGPFWLAVVPCLAAQRVTIIIGKEWASVSASWVLQYVKPGALRTE